jgi:lipoate synthase
VIWGEYDEPVRLAQAVHNLEHGQIVIWYRPDFDDLDFLERQIVTLVNQEPTATVGARVGDMEEGYNIVLTAWTHSRSCVNASQEVVDDFRRRFQGKGPERITPRFDG